MLSFKPTSQRKIAPAFWYPLLMLVALVAISVISYGWRRTLVGLIIVITSAQFLIGRCSRPKTVQLMLTGKVIMIPGGRKS